MCLIFFKMKIFLLFLVVSCQPLPGGLSYGGSVSWSYSLWNGRKLTLQIDQFKWPSIDKFEWPSATSTFSVDTNICKYLACSAAIWSNCAWNWFLTFATAADSTGRDWTTFTGAWLLRRAMASNNCWCWSLALETATVSFNWKILKIMTRQDNELWVQKLCRCIGT